MFMSLSLLLRKLLPLLQLSGKQLTRTTFEIVGENRLLKSLEQCL